MALGSLVDYSEHDVVNFFAFTGSSADRGFCVSLATGSPLQPYEYPTKPVVVYSGTAAIAASNNQPYTARYETKAKVRFTQSGEKPFGILLYNIRETDQYGQPLIFNSERKKQLLCVCSGETIPILRKGICHPSNALFATPVDATCIGKAVVSANGGDGKWALAAAGTAGAFGTVIGYATSGNANGGPVVAINCW